MSGADRSNTAGKQAWARGSTGAASGGAETGEGSPGLKGGRGVGWGVKAVQVPFDRNVNGAGRGVGGRGLSCGTNPGTGN